MECVACQQACYLPREMFAVMNCGIDSQNDLDWKGP